MTIYVFCNTIVCFTLQRRLRNKMKKRMKIPPINALGDEFKDLEMAYANAFNPTQLSQPMLEDFSPMNDVDFKYLSQLIHKVDLNKTKPGVIPKPTPNRMIIDQLNVNPMIPMRRSYTAQNPTPPAYYSNQKSARPISKADEENESFYSNLGKQIASLIRKVDTNGGSEIDIQIEQNHLPIKSPMQTVFNENRYSPRSYWERFVRSPLKHEHTLNQQLDNFKHSNEHLFDLENQVNVATAIERIMSLQELENIANIMEKKHAQLPHTEIIQLKPKRKPIADKNKHFNINLLPILRNGPNSKSHFQENNIKNKHGYKEPIDRNIIFATRNTNPKNNRQNVLSFDKHINYINNSPATNINNINVTQKNRVNSTMNIRKDLFQKLLKSPQITPLHEQVSRIVQRNATIPARTMSAQHNILNYPLNPLRLNYKTLTLNHVGKSLKQYHAQGDIIPFPVFSHTIKSSRTNVKPSYFQHEFRHFDFFN